MHIIEEHDKKRIISAASAVTFIAASREALKPIPRVTLDRWLEAPEKEIQDVLCYNTKVPYPTRLNIALLHASRCANKAIKLVAHDELQAAISSLVDAVWYIANDNTISQTANAACALATQELLALQRHPRSRMIRSGIKKISPLSSHSDFLEEGLGLEWDNFCIHLSALRKGITPPSSSEDSENNYSFNPTISVADALISNFPILPESGPPAYDSSDKERRVSKVNLFRFRGSPGRLSLDLSKRDLPVSAIILGDNGSGKSTLADSIEFALQGRIGRSIAFDSPLAPSANSLAANDLAEVIVTLDNGIEVSRRLENKKSGRLGVDIEDVRPGFRLAPISLKRQDILRFLDTGAMARGHVFFDYFPVNASEMAIRPEELLARLDDEEYELRVLRTHFSEVLGAALGSDPQEIANKDKLEAILKSQVLNGQTLAQAKRSGEWDQVAESIRLPVIELMQIQKRLRGIKNEKSRGIMTKNPILYRAQVAALGQALEGIGDLLTSAFKEITSASHISRIDVVFGRSGPVALDIVAELSTGRRCFPQQIFSEGYRDLLAILFFLVVAKRATEKGQARILILDDVFQSVDSSIRSGTVEYILKEFHDWQLLFTVHDRLWFEQLTNALRRHQHPFVQRELKRWRFDTGIVTTVPGDFRSNLSNQLSNGDPTGICSAAGFLLEQASDQLSWRLGTSVKRTNGDKYTLGALWPGVAKELRRHGLATICDPIDRHYSLRNLAGAHFNEWAGSLSRDEAESFGDSVQNLVRSTWCPTCNDWIAKDGSVTRCQCGKLALASTSKTNVRQ